MLHEGVRRRYAGSFESTARWLKQQRNRSSLLDVHFVFHDIRTTPFRIDWNTGPNEFTRIVIDPQTGRLLLDRSHSGLKNFSASFPGTYAAPLHIDRGRVDIQLLIDASSIEVLANAEHEAGVGGQIRDGPVGFHVIRRVVSGVRVHELAQVVPLHINEGADLDHEVTEVLAGRRVQPPTHFVRDVPAMTVEQESHAESLPWTAAALTPT